MATGDSVQPTPQGFPSPQESISLQETETRLREIRGLAARVDMLRLIYYTVFGVVLYLIGTIEADRSRLLIAGLSGGLVSLVWLQYILRTDFELRVLERFEWEWSRRNGWKEKHDLYIRARGREKYFSDRPHVHRWLSNHTIEIQCVIPFVLLCFVVGFRLLTGYQMVSP